MRINAMPGDCGVITNNLSYAKDDHGNTIQRKISNNNNNNWGQRTKNNNNNNIIIWHQRRKCDAKKQKQDTGLVDRQI